MTDVVTTAPTGRQPTGYQLTDRYDADDGTVVLTGPQAITRIPARPPPPRPAAGLRTGGLASGYPGSPLGGLDLTLHRAAATLAAEDVAARARRQRGARRRRRVRHPAAVPRRVARRHPGRVRHSGTASRRARIAAATCSSTPTCSASIRNGGVFAVVGDDPAAKSSSLPSQSETIFNDAAIPVLIRRVGTGAAPLRAAGQRAVPLQRAVGRDDGRDQRRRRRRRGRRRPRRLRCQHRCIELDGEPWLHRRRLDTAGTAIVDRERGPPEGPSPCCGGVRRGTTGSTASTAHGTTLDRLRRRRQDLLRHVRDSRCTISASTTTPWRARGIRLLKLGNDLPIWNAPSCVSSPPGWSGSSWSRRSASSSRPRCATCSTTACTGRWSSASATRPGGCSCRTTAS